jgi:hypothetical protein
MEKWWNNINHLNAELNPICHLLILSGDLTFMGACIVSVSNKMQRYTVYLYLETALHVSGGTCTHHQERIQLYLHLIYLSMIFKQQFCKSDITTSSRLQLLCGLIISCNIFVTYNNYYIWYSS